jgi:hypothetical protein
MTDNLATIHLAEIDRIIGTLSDLSALEVALRATFAL